MTKLCPRGKAAAKRKFKVYPSAYANAYASKICAGKIKDPSGTKRKDWGPKKASEGEFIKKPQPPLRNKKNIRRSLSPREIEYQKKKKAYDTLTGNEDKRPRPKRFKKGALMIVIGIGKKKKVDKKMGGGMTAGSQSALGRLQKARMMNKGGGADTGTMGERRSVMGVFQNKINRFLKDAPSMNKRDFDKLKERTKTYVKAESKKNTDRLTERDIKNAKRAIQSAKAKRAAQGFLPSDPMPKKMGGGMMKRYSKGGGFDAGTPGKVRDIFNKQIRIGNRIRGKGPTKDDIDKLKKIGRPKLEKIVSSKKFNKGGMADYYKDLM